MKIQINRDEKIIILQWLKRGFIETDDLPQLNDVKNKWFEALIKRRTEVTDKKK